MRVLKKKFLKCLRVRKVVDIGLLRPSTLTEVIVEVMDVGLFIIDTLPLIIAEDVLVDVDLGHKRPDTITPEIA